MSKQVIRLPTLATTLRQFLPKVFEKYGALNARQYAYRAEAEHLVKKNQFGYVNKVLTELRERGIIPWSGVLDSSRDFQPFPVQWNEDPNSHLNDAIDDFKSFPDRFALPSWQYQEIIPVIFTEKVGLIPYFEKISNDRAVSIYAQKGQVGKSHLHEVIMPWMKQKFRQGKTIRILYLGDCDDEGFQIPLTTIETLEEWMPDIRIERDTHHIDPRLSNNLVNEGSELRFTRLALTPDQVESYQLDKDGINQNSGIANKFVDFKAELEALDPDELRSIIEAALNETWDEDSEQLRIERQQAMQHQMKERITLLTKSWNTIDSGE